MPRQRKVRRASDASRIKSIRDAPLRLCKQTLTSRPYPPLFTFSGHFVQSVVQTTSVALCLGSYRLFLRTCRPSTYSLPPVLDVVSSFAILDCPRIRVYSIDQMALLASLRVLRSTRRSFRPEWCPNARRRRSLCLLQRRIPWATVCRPSPHSHSGSEISGYFSLNRKSPSMIFSFRSWTRSALWPWCSQSTFLVGASVCLCDLLPLVSDCHLALQRRVAPFWQYVWNIILRERSSAGFTARCPCPPSAFLPVASFAAISAASLPGLIVCAWHPLDAHFISPIAKVLVLLRNLSQNVCTRSTLRSDERPDGSLVIGVYNNCLTLVTCVHRCLPISGARQMPCNSVAYIVDVVPFLCIGCGSIACLTDYGGAHISIDAATISIDMHCSWFVGVFILSDLSFSL